VYTNSFSFAALRGKQGRRDYYVIQCPLRLVSRLLLFDEPEVPEPIRRSRTIDSTRVEQIKQQLLEQSDTYVLAPFVVSADAPIEFIALQGWPVDMGEIRFPITTRLFVRDGAHRRTALQQLLSTIVIEDTQTVPIMIFFDPEQTFSTTLYTLVNSAPVPQTKSQRVLNDSSTQLAALVRHVIETVPLFKGLTETERTTISNRSTALFTASAIYQATHELLGTKRDEAISPEDALLAELYWTHLGATIPEYAQAIKREVSTADLRQNYVHAHGIMLIALGRAGHVLVRTYPNDWRERMAALGDVDWSRSNTKLWEGRAMVLGRMSKATNSIKLATGAIKTILGLPKTDEEEELEQLLASK
jgi:DNA sulfur modification protein DndB